MIDPTNPIADAPPKNGVLSFFTNLDESLMEILQREFSDAWFVKAFNSVGNARMVNPQFEGVSSLRCHESSAFTSATGRFVVAETSAILDSL